jgi:hypothetical protein
VSEGRAPTNGEIADGKAVWSRRPAIFCPSGKLKKLRPMKGFYGLTARVVLLPERVGPY